MNLHRRELLTLGLGSIALAGSSRASQAADYPSQPVHLIVPYAPGGTTDTVGRSIVPWLSERLNQSFVIDARPGAGTNVGTEVVAHASPDGYSLLLFDPAAAINATLYDKLNFNFIRDIAPIVNIFSTPLVIVVNPAVPAKTLAEFIAYAKANPGKINMASAGNGSTSQLAGELLMKMAGIQMTHIPYRGGGPAIVNLLGGQVDVFFSPVAIAVSHVQAGKLRALAVTSTARSAVMPDVPAAGEIVKGFETSYWVGLGAPKATPAAIVDKLNKEINVALADPKLQARFADLGGVAAGGSAADFAKLVADETEKWGKVVRDGNIKPE